jgi:NAD(P)-dependent dehydrogenase (short-subunit alcohol dehydrogenase family)
VDLSAFAHELLLRSFEEIWMEDEPTSFNLSGKKAIITGASRGIGQALAVGFARAGADVAVSARSQDSLAATVDQIRTVGRRPLALAMDVSQVASCAEALGEAVHAMGGLDILVNNAGVEQVRPSFEVDESLWDLILDTNLKGAFFASQAAAKVMRAGGGAILNLCSLTSEVGIPTAVPYGSSKTGLLGMTRALAAEWGPLGIRVNAIAPGYFRTAMTEVFYRDEAWQQAMLQKIPMGRFGRLEDLLGAAIFLCSPAAAYITGVCLPVDGGFLASV